MDAGALICPGCGEKKTARAELCSNCRLRANAVGASVITKVGESAIPAESLPPRPRTPQQNTVYHARITDLAKIELAASEFTKADLRVAERNVKRRALAHANVIFKRPIASSTELSEIEMERLLEWLDEQLEQARSRAA